MLKNGEHFKKSPVVEFSFCSVPCSMLPVLLEFVSKNNFKRYFVFLRIQYECGKIRARITPNTDTFYAIVSHGVWHGASRGRKKWKQANEDLFYVKLSRKKGSHSFETNPQTSIAGLAWQLEYGCVSHVLRYKIKKLLSLLQISLVRCDIVVKRSKTIEEATLKI